MGGMITRYKSGGPSPPVVILSAIAFVLACIALWSLSVRVMQGVAINEQARIAQAQPTDVPLFRLNPTHTPRPECEAFRVHVDLAVIRSCPHENCEVRFRVPFDSNICVYSLAENSEQYPRANEWYIIDLNENRAFIDLAYMHRSVIEARNPTPIPTRTFTPLPTITPTPSPSQTPFVPLVVTATPEPGTIAPTFAPPITPTRERSDF